MIAKVTITLLMEVDEPEQLAHMVDGQLDNGVFQDAIRDAYEDEYGGEVKSLSATSTAQFCAGAVCDTDRDGCGWAGFMEELERGAHNEARCPSCKGAAILENV